MTTLTAKRHNARIILTIILFYTNYALLSMIMSQLTMLFPSEAEAKGAPASQYSLVIGANYLSTLIFAPLFGTFGGKIGQKTLYNFGAFLIGLSAVGLGLAAYIEQTAPHIALSCLFRLLDGLGQAAIISTMMTILLSLYPNSAARLSGLNEITMSLGYVLAPTVGAGLSALGGFHAVFFSFGAAVLLVSTALLILLSKVELSGESGQEQHGNTEKSLTLADIFKTCTLATPLLDVFLICFCFMSMTTTLSSHMANGAQASQIQVSIGFTINATFAFVSSMIVGGLADRMNYPVIFSVAGNIFFSLGLFFVGPAPFLSMKPDMYLIYGALASNGIGYDMVVVSAYARLHSTTKALGYSKDEGTNLLLSALFVAAMQLGFFSGSTLAGVLVDNFGFRKMTLFPISFMLVMCLMNATELISTWLRRKRLDYGPFASQ